MVRRSGAALAGTLLICGLAACSSGSDHSGTSHTAIASAARQAHKNPRSCPLRINLAGALKKAGAAGEVRPYSENGESAASGTVATPSSTLPPVRAERVAGESALAVSDGAEAECTYLLSGSRTLVNVWVIDVRRGRAVNLMAPQIVARARLSMSQISQKLKMMNRALYGTPTVLGSPATVVVVRLRTTDHSDAALLIDTSSPGSLTPPTGSLHGSELGSVAKTVAGQITTPLVNLH